MYNNIYETVVKGSNTMFLGISEEDYFLSYENLDNNSAQDLVNKYFRFKGRDGAPNVLDVDFDSVTHNVKITVEVNYDEENKAEPTNIPNFFSKWRQ
jgi:hypothetical protein